MDDLSITKEGNILNIEGTTGSSNDDVTYIHKGIGGRNFTRTFTLNDHVEVSNATLTNGILTIDLERIVPEALQPKKIAINGVDTNAIEGEVEYKTPSPFESEEEKVKVSN